MSPRGEGTRLEGNIERPVPPASNRKKPALSGAAGLVIKRIGPETFVVDPYHDLRILIFQLLFHIMKHLLGLGTVRLDRSQLFLGNGTDVVNDVSLTKFLYTIVGESYTV